MVSSAVESNSVAQEDSAERYVEEYSHPYAILGAVAWLVAQSPYHRQWNAHDFNIEIMPALLLSQFRIYHDANGDPIGFVSWANISDEVRDVLLNRERLLCFEDWTSGDNLLFNDFIAPFGHGAWIVNDLRRHVFRGRQAFSLRRNLDGSIRKINRWWGCNDHQQPGQSEVVNHLGRQASVQSTEDPCSG